MGPVVGRPSQHQFEVAGDIECSGVLALIGDGQSTHHRISLGRQLMGARHRQAGIKPGREPGAIEVADEVTADAVGFEFMLNALRLVDGVPVDLFASHTGWSPALIGPALAQGVARGLIDPDPTRLKATDLGLRFLNDTQALFLKAATDPA